MRPAAVRNPLPASGGLIFRSAKECDFSGLQHYTDMKRTFTITIILFCFLTTASAQKIKKAEARRILETAIATLKSSDSASFVHLWFIDGKPAPFHNNPFTGKTAMSYFYYLREFVDTALINNLKIYDIEVSRLNAVQQAQNFGKYNIKVWFRYSDKYYKGFGFFVDYINEKWVVRYIPDTSTRSTG